MSEERDRYPLVEIRWDDASIETHDFKEADAAKSKAVDRWTAGYLIHENDERVVLATDWFVSKKRELSARMVIPKGMITEYWVIGSGKR